MAIYFLLVQHDFSCLGYAGPPFYGAQFAWLIDEGRFPSHSVSGAISQ